MGMFLNGDLTTFRAKLTREPKNNSTVGKASTIKISFNGILHVHI